VVEQPELPAWPAAATDRVGRSSRIADPKIAAVADGSLALRQGAAASAAALAATATGADHPSADAAAGQKTAAAVAAGGVRPDRQPHEARQALAC
jgi:hypothetical protein